MQIKLVIESGEPLSVVLDRDNLSWSARVKLVEDVVKVWLLQRDLSFLNYCVFKAFDFFEKIQPTLLIGIIPSSFIVTNNRLRLAHLGARWNGKEPESISFPTLLIVIYFYFV